MRIPIAIPAILCLLGAGIPASSAADVAASASAAVAKMPAVNQTILERCLSLASSISSTAKTAKDAAQQAAALPFAGEAAKKALEKARMKSADADALVADVKGLLAGAKPVAGSLVTKVATGGTNLAEQLKGLPGADVLQQILATPGLVDALAARVPADSLAGFAAIKPLLAK